MVIDYKKIRDDKKREYGTKVGNVGRQLANLYADRSHFILELLQNAEDALGKRGEEWRGTRAVSFRLTKDELRFKHSGRPFDEADVRGICEIGESDKAEDVTAVGRFGIGFKSVYKITDRPEIHSGPEDFAVENYVWPVAVPAVERDAGDTVFVFPLKSDEEYLYDDIAEGLRGLSASTLLFLHQIEEIEWSVDDGRSGHYLRDPETMEDGIRKVTVIGEEFGQQDVSEEWLVFSRPVTSDEGKPAGYVEVAFSLETEAQKIQPVSDSRLVAFFPTDVRTHLGFLIQGPYQTTPSRDNVPSYVPWNKHLVEETSRLLVQALRWLRDRGDLTTDVLRCLPLDWGRYRLHVSRVEYGPLPRFAPLFNATKQAISTERLLPSQGSGYVSASRALLGRTEGIRQLFSTSQLAALYGNGREKYWLSGDITQDRTPQIRDYLMNELGVEEIDPESITRKLYRTFLEAQSDDWIRQLYEFLGGQRAIVQMLTQRHRYDRLTTPIVRLTDGKHVRLGLGEREVFLPGEGETDFPTVRRSVCSSPGALSFLRDLGLREPDLVDDVTRNLLPKYRRNERSMNDAEYEADIGRILRAYATDSNAQREKLLAELRKSSFVRAVDAGTSKNRLSKPGEVYLPTERLNELFDGVAGVWFVDDNCSCLRSEGAQALLEACGATTHLKPVRFDPNFTRNQLSDLRKGDGSTRGDVVSDWTLRGLDDLLKHLESLDSDLRHDMAEMLWEALVDCVEHEGTRCFRGTYEYFYYSSRISSFTAAFVKKLNETAWVLGEGEILRRPSAVDFDTLGWKEHTFLQSQIPFMPPKLPVIDSLAKEVGIETESINLLVEHGVTTERLREWLGVTDVSGGGVLVATATGSTNGPPSSPSALSGTSGPAGPFARRFHGVQTTSPSPGSGNPITLPPGGSITRESARRYTATSIHVGLTESHQVRLVSNTEFGPQGKALAHEFHNMVTGDYGKRCQICNRTFVRTGGGWQVNVVHVVPPGEDHRTNNFGDLLGLCGWHFNLLQHGEWALLDPDTDLPFEDANESLGWERMRDVILNREPDMDDLGNYYVGLPIRFFNVYHGSDADPVTVDECIRYSVPHWEFLCQLLNT